MRRIALGCRIGHWCADFNIQSVSILLMHTLSTMHLAKDETRVQCDLEGERDPERRIQRERSREREREMLYRFKGSSLVAAITDYDLTGNLTLVTRWQCTRKHCDEDKCLCGGDAVQHTRLPGNGSLRRPSARLIKGRRQGLGIHRGAPV